MRNYLFIAALLYAFTFTIAGCSKSSAPAQSGTTPVTPPTNPTPPVTPPANGLPHFKVNAGSGSFIVDSLGGPVTQNEINAFTNWMSGYAKPTANDGNQWVFGDPGKALEACGLMYDAIRNNATNNIGVLNRMIYYADAALAGRNDLEPAANGGQFITWTGKIDPVWPSSSQTTPAQAGVEQGMVLAHIAYCSLLILETPSIWNNTIPDNDPNKFGATYKARALTYLTQCDYVIDNWILPHFMQANTNYYFFPGAPNTYMPNSVAPWNQAWMLTDGFVRLAQCHAILNDAQSRLTQYDAIAKANINYFFANRINNISKIGSACYKWAYSGPPSGGLEDTNHFAYDCEGLFIAYYSGRYGLAATDILPYANTYIDIVLATVNSSGDYAGLVDGTYGSNTHSSGDNYVRDEYLYFADFRPDSYVKMARIDSTKLHSSPSIISRLFFEKSRRK
jgi:hypothetical protein